MWETSIISLQAQWSLWFYLIHIHKDRQQHSQIKGLDHEQMLLKESQEKREQMSYFKISLIFRHRIQWSMWLLIILRGTSKKSDLSKDKRLIAKLHPQIYKRNLRRILKLSLIPHLTKYLTNYLNKNTYKESTSKPYKRWKAWLLQDQITALKFNKKCESKSYLCLKTPMRLCIVLKRSKTSLFMWNIKQYLFQTSCVETSIRSTLKEF